MFRFLHAVMLDGKDPYRVNGENGVASGADPAELSRGLTGIWLDRTRSTDHAELIGVDADNVAGVELATAAELNIAVDRHVSGCDHKLRVGASVDRPCELEQLTEPDHVARDLDRPLHDHIVGNASRRDARRRAPGRLATRGPIVGYGNHSWRLLFLCHLMTYCLAMRLKEGLVFLSDTRTNAGVDNVGIYRKQHVFAVGSRRLFVIESAGNLATTQEVLDRIRRDLAAPGDVESLASVSHLFEAALYLGRLSRQVVADHRDALTGFDATATFILGGQIGEEEPEILLVYPEGNYIRASDELPFLQIGETKYGKFLLEMAATLDVDAETATKIALGSMMSTARANLSVGPPYDLGLYRRNGFEVEEFRIEADSPVLLSLQTTWERQLRASFAELPSFTREDLIRSTTER